MACAMALPALALASACEKPPAAPHNDNLAAATVLTAAPQGQLAGSTIGATRQKGEPRSLADDTVWYRWRAPSNGVVTFSGSSSLPVAIDAFTGPSLGHLRPASSSETALAATFRVAAGTNYAIRATGFAGSTFALKWATAGAPTNDARSAAAAISGGAGSLVTDATGATSQTTDPKIDTVQPPATVWYRWTAPATGVYDFDTHGSRVDTMIGAYTDATPTALLADSSGDCGGNIFDLTTAGIQFAATSGTSYLIMVSGTLADEPNSASLGGPVQLNWRAATAAPVASGNDAFASPAHITGNYGSIAGDTSGATAETGEPSHEGSPARASVWFTWTPTVTSDYVLTALPDDEEACAPGLSLYTGNSLATLRAVHSLDDDFLMSTVAASQASGATDAGPSAYGLRVHLFAGTTYSIASDGGADPGSFALRWDIPQAAPTIRSATSGNGSIGVIWSPPKNTSGSARTGYFVAVIPTNESDFDTPDSQLLPVNYAFTTIKGLRNGSSYRVMVAAINGSGLGDIAISRPVTPKK
jgi:hypothetical protein